MTDFDDLLDQLESLDDDDVWLLADEWAKGDEAARRRAWAQAKRHIEATGRDRDLDRARHDLGRWMQAGRSDFHGMSGLLGQAGATVHGRQAAAPAIADAAAAILAGDALPTDDADVLLAPWRALQSDRADRAHEESDQSSA